MDSGAPLNETEREELVRLRKAVVATKHILSELLVETANEDSAFATAGTRMQNLIDLGADVNHFSWAQEGQTALTNTCKRGNLLGTQMLLAAKAEPDQPNGEGHAPLHILGDTNVPVIALSLIDAGADLTLKDSVNGRMPLQQAEEFRNSRLVIILRSATAKQEANNALLEIGCDTTGPRPL